MALRDPPKKNETEHMTGKERIIMKKNITRLLAVLLACFMSFQSIPAFHACAVDEEATQEAVMPADRQSEKTEEETEVSPEDPVEATTENTDETQENPVEVKTEETEISPENPVEETTEELEVPQEEAVEQQEEATLPVFSSIAEDSLLSEAELNSYDFSSRRLLVAGPRNLIPDPEHILSEYNGVYLLQYPNEITARNAYSYYYGKAEFADIDCVIHVAGGEDGAVSSSEMAAGDTPMDELAQAVSQSPAGLAGTVIALIDTGVNGTENIIESVSMLGDDTSDANGHGTHMAELIRRQNPHAQILSIKALGADGSGDLSAVYAAIEYAKTKQVDIINLSLCAPVTAENAALTNVIAQAIRAGIRVVAAAGNKGRNAGYFTPANIPGVITIGACDGDGQRLSQSNYGSVVNANVVAQTTSEAAAIYTGLLSVLGTVDPDEQQVFPVNYVKPTPAAPEKTHKLSILSPSTGHVRLTIGKEQMELYMDGEDHLSAKGNLPYTTEPAAEGSVYQNFVFEVKDQEQLTVKAVPEEDVRFSAMFVNDQPLFKDTCTFAMTEDTAISVTYQADGARFEAQDAPKPDVANGTTTSGTFTILRSYHTASSHVNDYMCDRFLVELHGGLLDGVQAWFRCINPGVNAPLPGMHAVSYEAQVTVTESGSDKSFDWNVTCYTPAGRQNMRIVGSYHYDIGKPMGRLMVTKSSTIPGATVSNDLYDFGGTTFVLYTDMYVAAEDEAKNFANALETKTIATGDESVMFDGAFPVGTHVYVAEIASNDCYYRHTQTEPAVQWHEVEILDPSNPATLFGVTMDDFGNEPKMNTLSIKKRSNPDGAVEDLSGVIFRVTWIGAAYTDISWFEEDKDGNGTPEWIDDLGRNKPSRTWYFQTDSNGDAQINEDYLFNGTAGGVTYTSDTFDWPSNNTGGTVHREMIPYGSVYVYEEYCPPTLIKNPSKFRLGAGTEMTNRVFMQSDDRGMVDHSTGTVGVEIVATNDAVIVPGHIRLTKTSEFPSVTDNNAAYDMTGIQYQVYDEDQRLLEGKVLEITSYDSATSTGTSSVVELPLGRYYVKEIEDSVTDTGYLYDSTMHGPFEVESTNTPTLPKTVTVEEQVKMDPVDILLHKVDANGTPSTQGGSSLENARISISYYADTTHTTLEEVEEGEAVRSWVFQTDETGRILYHPSYKVSGDDLFTDADGINALPAGTLVVSETVAPAGYKLNTDRFLITIDTDRVVYRKADGTQIQSVALPLGNQLEDSGFLFYESAIRGGVKVVKWDQDRQGAEPTGDADLSGITFMVKNTSGNTVVVNGTEYAHNSDLTGLSLVSDAAGSAQTAADALPYGDYTVREVSSNGSYRLTDGREIAFQIRTDGRIVDISAAGEDLVFENEPVRGSLEIHKAPNDTPDPEGNASLSGIRFAVINASEKAVKYKDTMFEPGRVMDVITTGADGCARTDEGSLSYGTYRVCELHKDADVSIIGEIYEGNPKAGTSPYANDSYVYEDNEATVEVHGDNARESVSFTNEEIKGSAAVKKKDSQTAASQGDARFLGIRFAIVNRSANPVKLGDTEYASGEVMALITTDAAGNAALSDSSLAFGEYDIYELKASATIAAGDLYDGSEKLGSADDIYANHSGYLWQNNSRHIKIETMGQMATAEFTDQVVRGGASFLKMDGETLALFPQSGASLKGAEITIRNDSAADVMVNGTRYAPGEDVLTVETAEDGTASTEARVLPYGTYTARETKASPGYKRNTDWKVTFHITKEGEIIETGASDPLPEELMRADLAFLKVDEKGEPMANIPFAISLLDKDGNVVETHVMVTDDKGFASTAARAKDETANTLDAFLSDGHFTDSGALDAAVNVWFGAGAPAAGKGSLIPGDYLLEELQCAANQGQAMLKQTIHTDPFTDGKLYLAGNVFVDLDIETVSNLTDNASQSKSVVIDPAAELMDEVTFHHLKSEETYRAETEFFYEDRMGTKTSVGLVHTIFTATSAKKTLEHTVTVDTSDMEGGKIHAVDRLYMNWRGEEILIATHNTDFAEESQTVYVPYMRTRAADVSTGDHVGSAGNTAKISDQILYEGLADGRLYHAQGILRFADSGEIVKDASGAECRVDRVLRVSYSASEVTEGALDIYVCPRDGVLPMPYFELDTTVLQGRSLVVTETLYDYDSGKPILTHEDLTDENQRIYIPKVTTTAKDSKTNAHIGTMGTKEKVIDRVVLENLMVGQTYEVKGTLVYKEDCIDAQGTAHKAGDVIATHPKVTLVAESTTETLDIVFEVDSTAFQGVSGVVFEDLYHQGVPVAVHHDLDSREQTVSWPAIHTTATDALTRDHTGAVTEKAIVQDEVRYENLVPGLQYQIKGKLVIRGREDEVLAEEGYIFIPKESNGSFTLAFEFDASGLAGETAVAFEYLYLDENLIAAHAEPEDEGQSVHYPKIQTKAKDLTTGERQGYTGPTRIEDVVKLSNLIVGQTCDVSGVLMDKATGQPVLDGKGREIRAEKKDITATDTEMEVTVVFSLDATILAGRSCVVFEDLMHNGVYVAGHADLEDEDQTIWYPNRKPPVKTVPKTGDPSKGWLWAGLLAAALLGMICLLRKWRKLNLFD